MLVLFLFGLLLLGYDLVEPLGAFIHGYTTNMMCAGERGGALQKSSEQKKLSLDTKVGLQGKKRLTPQLAFFLNQPLQINSASQEDLVLLPGVGPHLARNIILFRQQHGAITSASELANIPGIGKKLEKKISSVVSFDFP